MCFLEANFRISLFIFAQTPVMREEVSELILPWVIATLTWFSAAHHDLAIDIAFYWPTAQLQRKGWGRAEEFR